METLAELFPEGDFRFHLTLRRGDPAEFFTRREATGQVRAQRRAWLAAEPARYAVLEGEGAAAFAEFAELCAGWGVEETGTVGELGGVLEPDFLLLTRDAEGRFRLRGGALCFPTGWALEEKIGGTMEAIHGVVPGLNAALGAQIDQFLGRLRPGVAFLRDNWGLAATDELNLHPARGIGAPVPPVELERLWLRVEHQALVGLPRSGAVLFGIRVVLHRLDVVAKEPAVRSGLVRALESMPADLALYKRIEQIRGELCRKLAS